MDNCRYPETGATFAFRDKVRDEDPIAFGELSARQATLTGERPFGRARNLDLREGNVPQGETARAALAGGGHRASLKPGTSSSDPSLALALEFEYGSTDPE